MRDELITLLAALDTDYWELKDIRNWADQIISCVDFPESWVCDLSLAREKKDCLVVIRRAMQENAIQVPLNYGDLLIGFILLRYDLGQIDQEKAKSLILDEVDSYDGTHLANLTVESALNLPITDLLNKGFLELARDSICKVTQSTKRKLD